MTVPWPSPVHARSASVPIRTSHCKMTLMNRVLKYSQRSISCFGIIDNTWLMAGSVSWTLCCHQVLRTLQPTFLLLPESALSPAIDSFTHPLVIRWLPLTLRGLCGGVLTARCFSPAAGRSHRDFAPHRPSGNGQPLHLPSPWWKRLCWREQCIPPLWRCGLFRRHCVPPPELPPLRPVAGVWCFPRRRRRRGHWPWNPNPML